MIKNTNLSPIVLFVYNRPEHTRMTIEALQNNTLAKESILYIYSDGSKNNKADELVMKVRKYIKKVSGFKKVILIERNKNFGLAASIIDGVSSVMKEYGKVIVLEDDLITSKYFLKYMNSALEKFEKDDRIFSITGFSFSRKFMHFPPEYKEDIYLNIRPMSWSWATWSNRWEDIDWKVKEYNQFIKNAKQIKKFNNGGTDLTRMLKNQMKGKLNSWYIRWTFNSFLENKLTVYPVISYVNNIGHDASGIHCVNDEDNIYSHSELSTIEDINLNVNIFLINEIVKNFNKGFNTNYKRIIKRKLNIILNRIKKKQHV